MYKNILVVLAVALMGFSCKSAISKNEDVAESVASINITTDTLPAEENAASYHDEYKGRSITGHFTYFADAAVFQYCDSKKTLPVSMEGEYKKTEQAYLNSVENGGDPAFIELLGEVLQREDMEGHLKDHLVIDQLIELNPYRNCEER